MFYEEITTYDSPFIMNTGGKIRISTLKHGKAP